MIITQQLDTIRRLISECAKKQQRAAEEITLLAVSKRHSADNIRTAFKHQQIDFGENYLNEALEKQAQLSDLAIRWHYIGSIQSNKTRKIAENFAWVHTVDSLRIARRLAAQRPEHLAPLNICLQINIDQEASKSGLAPDLDILLPLVAEIQTLTTIKLKGLMCIPAPKNNKDEERQTFRKMQTLRQQINQHIFDKRLDTLSMGMSDDLDTAIECGATIVRVGTAIFGQRS